MCCFFSFSQNDSLKTEDGSLSSAAPDICIAYKLHLECGRLINLYDWLEVRLCDTNANDISAYPFSLALGRKTKIKPFFFSEIKRIYRFWPLTLRRLCLLVSRPTPRWFPLQRSTQTRTLSGKWMRSNSILDRNVNFFFQLCKHFRHP